MLGAILGNIVDKLTPSQLHPLVDGAAAALDFSSGDPIGGTEDVLRTTGDLSNSGAAGAGASPSVDSYSSLLSVLGGSAMPNMGSAE